MLLPALSAAKKKALRTDESASQATQRADVARAAPAVSDAEALPSSRLRGQRFARGGPQSAPPARIHLHRTAQLAARFEALNPKFRYTEQCKGDLALRADYLPGRPGRDRQRSTQRSGRDPRRQAGLVWRAARGADGDDHHLLRGRQGALQSADPAPWNSGRLPHRPDGHRLGRAHARTLPAAREYTRGDGQTRCPGITNTCSSDGRSRWTCSASRPSTGWASSPGWGRPVSSFSAWCWAWSPTHLTFRI